MTRAAPSPTVTPEVRAVPPSDSAQRSRSSSSSPACRRARTRCGAAARLAAGWVLSKHSDPERPEQLGQRAGVARRRRWPRAGSGAGATSRVASRYSEARQAGRERPRAPRSTPPPSGWRYIGVSGASGGRGGSAAVARVPSAAIHDGAARLGEVVVVAGQPEDRHHRPAPALLQDAGEGRGAERLVDGVQRPGEEARLLTGGDREGAGLPQPGRAPRRASPRARTRRRARGIEPPPGRGAGSSSGCSSGVATKRRLTRSGRRGSCAGSPAASGEAS